jgi:hypothetical protein
MTQGQSLAASAMRMKKRMLVSRIGKTPDSLQICPPDNKPSASRSSSCWGAAFSISLI